MQPARPVANPVARQERAPGTAPAPRTAPLAPPRSLPHAVTRFVGREREVAEVTELLVHHRMVCLTGAGGAGKSRLAVEVGRRLESSRPDGVRLLELAAITHGAQLAPTIAATLLAIEGTTEGGAFDAVASAIDDRDVLLLLDNCEHLAAAVSRTTTALMEACPRLQVVATSRLDLDAAGAVHLRVPPLSTLPGADGSSPAVALFEDRARLAAGRFTSTPEVRAVVTEICTRLDGLPYAIELAASRLPALGVRDLLAWLDLELGGPQPTDLLGTLISWGREELTGSSRRLLDGLAVFAGSFDLDAVRAVAVDDQHAVDDVLTSLTDLVRRSLLTAGEVDGRATYHLLRTTREHCRARLDESPDASAWHARHLRWAADLVHAEDPDAWFAQSLATLPVVRRHLPDLHIAVRTALAGGQFALALPLASRALEVGFHDRAPTGDLTDAVETALAGTSGKPSRARLEAMLWLAEHQDASGEAESAGHWYEAAAVEARSLGDPGMTAYTVGCLGEFALSRGDLAEAQAQLRGACEGLHAVGRDDEAGLFRIRLAAVLVRLGSIEEARDELESARLEMRGAHQRPEEIAAVAAAIAVAEHDAPTAVALLEDAVAVAREVMPDHVACVLEGLAAHQRIAIGPRAAVAAYREALDEVRSHGPVARVLACVRGLAAAVADRGDPEVALRLLAGVEVQLPVHDAGHVVRTSALLVESELVAADLVVRESVEAGLPRSLAERIRAEGRRLSIEELAREALVATTPTPAVPSVQEVEPAGSSLVRNGAVWQLAHDGRSVAVGHSKGMVYLAELLSRPEREVHVLDLVAQAMPPAGTAPVLRQQGLVARRGSGGDIPRLDEQARRTYGARVEDLRARAEEAEAFGDAETVARTREELDAIARELAGAYGIGGRARPTGDAERARKAVTKCLRTAIERVRDVDPATGRHLDGAVRTGTWCRYEPPDPVRWHVRG